MEIINFFAPQGNERAPKRQAGPFFGYLSA